MCISRPYHISDPFSLCAPFLPFLEASLAVAVMKRFIIFPNLKEGWMAVKQNTYLNHGGQGSKTRVGGKSENLPSKS